MESRRVDTIGHMFRIKTSVSKSPKACAQHPSTFITLLLAPPSLPSTAFILIVLPLPNSILGHGTGSPARTQLLLTVADSGFHHNKAGSVWEQEHRKCNGASACLLCWLGVYDASWGWGGGRIRTTVVRNQPWGGETLCPKH